MEVAKWFTAARRIPQLIGKLPGGQSIPWGPYTITQVLAGAGAIYVLNETQHLWARWSWVGNIVVATAVVAGVVFLTGKIPNAGRNPLGWALGIVTLMTGDGSSQTRQTQVRKPRRITHRYIHATRAHQPMPTPAPVPVDAPVAEPFAPAGSGQVPAAAGEAPRPVLVVRTAGDRVVTDPQPLSAVSAFLAANTGKDHDA